MCPCTESASVYLAPTMCTMPSAAGAGGSIFAEVRDSVLTEHQEEGQRMAYVVRDLRVWC